jgi:hypothetical protein
MRKLNNQIFIDRARKIHGNLYDYSNVKYKGNHAKVSIICREHGEFKKSPAHHIYGTRQG